MQENTLFVVYIQFFALIERLLKKNYNEASKQMDIHHYFVRQLTEMGLRSTERNAVMSFYKLPVGVLDADFKPESPDLVKVSVRSLYIKLCDLIGPIETDKLFGISLDKVSMSNAGKVYSPRKYLV